jgi:hypothetical protein
MKWIVLAIVVSIAVYTFLTLHYRKPGAAFSPYRDIKDRANTKRLLTAGYQRIALEAELPTESRFSGDLATISAADPGLPSSLRDTLIDQPSLPAEIVSVTAAPAINSLFVYPISFKCTVTDHKQQLAGAELYIRDHDIVIAPDFQRLSGGLLSRSRENVIRLTVPAGALKPGTYSVTLAGARASRQWSLQVH